jgi:hypothetical protein
MDEAPIEEQQEVLQIITEYFRKEFNGDEKKVEESLGRLATMLQGEGVSLVHVGNSVFLIMVIGKGMVEVHTMAVDEDTSSLAKSFVGLADFLKSIDVKVAYTYTDKPGYEVVAKRTRLPFKTKKMEIEGKQQTVYYLEFK